MATFPSKPSKFQVISIKMWHYKNLYISLPSQSMIIQEFYKFSFAMLMEVLMTLQNAKSIKKIICRYQIPIYDQSSTINFDNFNVNKEYNMVIKTNK